MTINRIALIALLSFVISLALPVMRSADSAEPISFAVIFSGGPETGAEGETIINQFMSSLAKLTRMKKNAFRGKYFNSISEAKKYINENKNSYIMGSIGFYLAHRRAMNIVPLAVVKLRGNDKEQFYLIVRKGTYSNLKQLKGKTLAGNVLYEDKKFINNIIFNGELDVAQHFQLKPTNRPLSAVRKLSQGQFDAVLLNHMQYYSLKKLDVFTKIEVIHQSSKMPALGLMMVNTSTNAAAKDKIVGAVTRMCSQEDTKVACKNFGIDGFDTIEAGSLKDEITKYESAR